MSAAMISALFLSAFAYAANPTFLAEADIREGLASTEPHTAVEAGKVLLRAEKFHYTCVPDSGLNTPPTEESDIALATRLPEKLEGELSFARTEGGVMTGLSLLKRWDALPGLDETGAEPLTALELECKPASKDGCWDFKLERERMISIQWSPEFELGMKRREWLQISLTPAGELFMRQSISLRVARVNALVPLVSDASASRMYICELR